MRWTGRTSTGSFRVIIAAAVWSIAIITVEAVTPALAQWRGVPGTPGASVFGGTGVMGPAADVWMVLAVIIAPLIVIFVIVRALLAGLEKLDAALHRRKLTRFAGGVSRRHSRRDAL